MTQSKISLASPFAGRIAPQTPQWHGDRPYAQQFDDHYYQDEGASESTYVYLQGNDLTQRFKDCNNFTIAETGFGMGLNFALTAQLWQRTKQAHSAARLTYISCERHPVAPSDIERALNIPAIDRNIAKLIVAALPPCIPGWHILDITPQIRLILIYDDVRALAEICGRVDAWFLDGFAPSRNADIWKDELWTAMKQTAHSRTSASSFSAARVIKDGLAQAGFTWQKRPGYGNKRDHIIATSDSQSVSVHDREMSTTNSVAIIGAGIAGVSCARALAQRGYMPIVLERGPELGCGTSGNPGALVAPPIQSIPNPHADWQLQGYALALRMARQLGLSVGTGLLRSDNTEQLHRAVQWMFGENTGLPVPMAWGSIAEAVKQLVDHPNITIQFNQNIQAESLRRLQNEFDIVIDATAAGIAQTRPTKAIRGQISRFDVQQPHALSGGKYLAPDGQQVWAGATFDRSHEYDPLAWATTVPVFDKDDHENATIFSELDMDPPPTTARWAGIRHTSPDHLPFIGAPMHELLREPSESRQQFRNRCVKHGFQANLLCCNAIGTRGFAHGLLAAEVIAAYVHGEPLPVPTYLARAVAAARDL